MENHQLLRHKISSNVDYLDQLYHTVHWTPCRDSIRPTADIIDKKKYFVTNMLQMYHDRDDYVLHKLLGCTPELYNPSDGPYSAMCVRQIDRPAGRRRHCFIPNMFRYQVPPTTNHYVLWCALDTDESVVQDNEIDSIITAELRSRCQPNYEYIWYENPKPTMLADATQRHVYHVQVFWIDK